MEAASNSLLPFVGAIIRTLRHARGWSQEKLADEAGLFSNQISLLERAERDPQLETLERVARALGITCYALLWQAEMLRCRVEGEKSKTSGELRTPPGA